MTDKETLYRCRTCGWVGTEDEMEADAVGEPSDEAWSNWICGHCHTWWLSLDDYDKVESRAGSPETIPYGGG